jgi:alpha,alpha-trehalose phosphorylase
MWCWLVPAGQCVFPEAKQRNFEFYDPLTTGDSSLSSCTKRSSPQIGDMERAIRYGMAALLMDLADVGGNVRMAAILPTGT